MMALYQAEFLELFDSNRNLIQQQKARADLNIGRALIELDNSVIVMRHNNTKWKYGKTYSILITISDFLEC